MNEQRQIIQWFSFFSLRLTSFVFSSTKITLLRCNACDKMAETAPPQISPGLSCSSDQVSHLLTHFLSRETFSENAAVTLTSSQKSSVKKTFAQRASFPLRLPSLQHSHKRARLYGLVFTEQGQLMSLSLLHFIESSPLQTMLFVVITALASLWEWSLPDQKIDCISAGSLLCCQGCSCWIDWQLCAVIFV